MKNLLAYFLSSILVPFIWVTNITYQTPLCILFYCVNFSSLVFAFGYFCLGYGFPFFSLGVFLFFLILNILVPGWLFVLRELKEDPVARYTQNPHFWKLHNFSKEGTQNQEYLFKHMLLWYEIAFWHINVLLNFMLVFSFFYYLALFYQKYSNYLEGKRLQTLYDEAHKVHTERITLEKEVQNLEDECIKLENILKR